VIGKRSLRSQRRMPKYIWLHRQNDVTAHFPAAQRRPVGRGKGLILLRPALIETEFDPCRRLITCRVNGDLKQMASTAWSSIPHLITFVSSFMTIEAGDILMTGTPAAARSPGDVVGLQWGRQLKICPPNKSAAAPTRFDSGRRRYQNGPRTQPGYSHRRPDRRRSGGHRHRPVHPRRDPGDPLFPQHRLLPNPA
jgi:hypothetical protein